MFQPIGEWYSATELKADDNKLAARKTAGESLISTWNKAQAQDLLNAVSYGFEVLGPLGPTTNPAGPAVCSAIVDAQPSFAIETGATTLDPRLCALVTLSEFLARRLGKSAIWRRYEREVIVAEAIIAGLRYRDLTAGEFLNQRLEKLYASAGDLLDRMDESRRVRRSDSKTLLESLKSKTDLGGLRDALHDAMQLMFKDVELDREELQALWWVFGGMSRTRNERFTTMDPTVAAVTAGYELATITAWPGTVGMGALAARATDSDALFDPAALTQDAANLVLPVAQRVHPRRWPTLFPLLTVVADRAEGKGEIDFALRSSLNAGEAAQQAYAEFSLLGVLG